MKYFVVSDIHGHYDELLRDLTESGFDEQNINHHLIVVGDMGDRGLKTKEVYAYLFDLYRRDKATIILGNHDTFLINMIEKNFARCYFDIKYNGFDKTLESFLGYEVSMDTDLEEIHGAFYKQYHEYYVWLKELPYYFELGKYIFVHGGLDGSLSDWKNTPVRDLIWSREYEQTPIKNRVVVAGHQRVATIRTESKDYKKLYQEHPELFEIMDLGNKILIDGFVEVSKKINVLIIEL
jgi:serine/threonine protein phosphatase 1